MVENKEIRLKKDTKGEIQRLEEENAVLKELAARSRSSASSANPASGDPAQSNDTAIIEGMSRENEKAEKKIREFKEVVKSFDKALIEEKKRSHELQLHMIKDKNKVFVETKEEEVDIDTSMMGQNNAISEKQLKDLHENLASLRKENDTLKSDWAL